MDGESESRYAKNVSGRVAELRGRSRMELRAAMRAGGVTKGRSRGFPHAIMPRRRTFARLIDASGFVRRLPVDARCTVPRVTRASQPPCATRVARLPAI